MGDTIQKYCYNGIIIQLVLLVLMALFDVCFAASKDDKLDEE